MTAYDFYPYIKAMHLFMMVCWFAGIFYLPRLFVYHAQSDDQISLDRFHVMERKLYRGIMWPSMVLTLLFGGLMLWINPAWFSMGWMHAKLSLISILVVYHCYCGVCIQKFKDGTMNKSHVFFRIFNEIPVLILVAVILLAVIKPF